MLAVLLGQYAFPHPHLTHFTRLFASCKKDLSSDSVLGCLVSENSVFPLEKVSVRSRKNELVNLTGFSVSWTLGNVLKVTPVPTLESLMYTLHLSDMGQYDS